MSSTGSTAHEVIRPIRIGPGGKTRLRVASKVLLPRRQLLLAPEGPFGGGTMLCSGRFVGKRMVLALCGVGALDV
jgi:hypothetical protein